MKIRIPALSQPFCIFLAALVLVAVMGVSSDAFLTYQNSFNVLRNASFIAIMVLGMTPVLLSGGIDLSVGSVMVLSALAAGLVMQDGAGLCAGLATGLGVGFLCGAVNGALIAYARYNPFVVTLAMMSAARSLGLVVSNGKTIYQFGPDAELFSWLGGGVMLGLPIPALFMTLFGIVLAFVLRHMMWGRHVYAIGGNEKAALAVGVPIARIKFLTYVVSACAASACGMLMTGWLGGITNNLGTGYELQVVAAAVIGGISLGGGSGRVVGGLLGALLLELIRNAFIMAGFNSYWQGVFVGVTILAAIAFDKISRRFS